jgi:hypothetical protein
MAEETPLDETRAGQAAERKAFWGFVVVSLVVFGTVAFIERELFRLLSLYGAYAFWTALFVLGGAAVFLPLKPVSMSKGAFVGFFSLSFFVYAVAWCVAYFVIRKMPGEVVASIVAPAAFGILLSRGSQNGMGRLRLIRLVCLHGAGYFVGRVIWQAIDAPWGMLGWGLAYGAGFGAGICQLLSTRLSRRS